MTTQSKHWSKYEIAEAYGFTFTFPHRRKYLDFKSRKLKALVKNCTAFSSFKELVEAEGGYYPSLMGDDAEQLAIADAYDAYQFLHNDKRRASIVRPDKTIRSYLKIEICKKCL